MTPEWEVPEPPNAGAIPDGPVQRSSTPTASESPLPWGVVGTTVYRRLSPGRGPGLFRDRVGNGIDYVPPRLSAGEPFWVPLGGQELEMSWPGGPDPARVSSLADLGVRSLEEFRSELEAVRKERIDHPLRKEALLELDVFACRLLDLVVELHAQGYGLGLLNPQAILLRDTGDELKVLLPDLGFRRAPTFGILPHWLQEDSPFVRRWRPLWDEGKLSDLQLSDLPDPQPDLSKLARLFAWLLRGRVEATIPTRDQDPSTYSAIWNLLDDAVSGQLESAREFRDRLRPPGEPFEPAQPERVNLSDHFLPDPFEKSSRSGRGGWLALAGWAGVVLVGLGLVAGAAVWTHRPLIGAAPAIGADVAEVFPAQPTRELPADSRLLEPFLAFRQAGSPRERYQALVQLYQVRGSYDEGERQTEAQYREKARWDFLVEQDIRLDQLRLDVEQQRHLLPECLNQAEEIARWLRDLQRYPAHASLKEREEQCLQMYQEWIDQQYAVYGG